MIPNWFDIPLDGFMARALLAGLGVALATGPLGGFVVWRRMAYFGDTLSHSALLGITLGLALRLDLSLAILLVCLVAALGVAWIDSLPTLPTDTALGIISHTALALGLVTLSLLPGVRVDLMGYLFGDILTCSWRDVGMIQAGVVVVYLALYWLWRPLLNLTVHPELARVDGVAVAWVRLLFMLLLALVVALALKIIGALLITALLVIPAAAARPFVTTPRAMAVGATLISGASVMLGLFASLTWDTPSGPSIVLVAAIFFITASVYGSLRNQ